MWVPDKSKKGAKKEYFKAKEDITKSMQQKSEDV